jgi:hypothetical protein
MKLKGSNVFVDFIAISNQPDDSVGGAMISGTVSHSSVSIRLQAEPTEQLLLQQGLETPRMFTAVCKYLSNVRERDEFQVVNPYNHQYLNQRFRIIGVKYSSHNPSDPRSYMILEATRSVEAHARQ